MSIWTLNAEAMPPAPVTAGKVVINPDSGDSSRIKAIFPDGHLDILSQIGWRDRNLLLNPEFAFAQRQAPASLTTYNSSTSRVYAADRWAMVNSAASLQFANADTSGAPVTGLQSRYYGIFKQITNPGKWAVFQTIEGTDSAELIGRTVRFQFKARWTINPATIRFGLLVLGTGGTVDTLPSTIASAFGVASTDPTWGTNLSALPPVLTEANGTISGNGVTAVLSNAFQRFSATFVIPANILNVIPIIWTNGLPAANDIIQISEAGLYNGSEIRDYYPRSLGDELIALQRYYWKTFAIATAPAQNVGIGTGAWVGQQMIATTGAHAIVLSVNFPVRMRAAPTPTGYNPAAANAFMRNSSTGADSGSTTLTDITDRSLTAIAAGASGGVVGDLVQFHMTFDADI